MDDSVTWKQLWTQFIGEYREIRAQSTPIGYYDLTDMKAAFDAGAKAEDEHWLQVKTDQLIQVLKQG